MKRLAAIGTALMLAAACGSDSPTTPTNNTGPIVFTAQLSAAERNATDHERRRECARNRHDHIQCVAGSSDRRSQSAAAR